MEVGGLLKFLQLLQPAETSGNVAKGHVRRKRLSVESILRFFSSVRSGLIFPGFDLRAILRSKNLGALQIFFGINVLGFFLLGFFASTFLFRRVGDVLSVAFGRKENGAGKKQNPKNADS